MLGPQAVSAPLPLPAAAAPFDKAGRGDAPGRLRIVHCFRSPVGGIFRHVRDLAEAQAAAGHVVGIVCDSTTGGDLEEQLFEALKPSLALGVSRTPMQRHVGPGDLASAWRGYKIIKELQPDVLHGHGAKGGVYARMFGSLLRAYRYRVARLYTAHGGSLHYDETTAMGQLFFSLERMMERFTDHILFVSEYERQAFRRKVGEPRPPSSLVYNGLRESEFDPVASDPDAADFLYIGMMRDLKGPDIFIDALAQAEIRARSRSDGRHGRRRRRSAALRSPGETARPGRTCTVRETYAGPAGLSPWPNGRGSLACRGDALYRA